MTKRELVKMLEPWPDNAEIEISVDPNASMDEVGEGLIIERFWTEIMDVEKPRTPEEIEKYKIDKDDANVHCLIFTGKVTMC